MTGFKEGASSDPFGDSDGGDESEEYESETETESEPESPESVAERSSQSTPSTSSTTDVDHSSVDDGLPWLYSRNGITDGRAQTVQLHMQRETATQEDEFQTEVRQQLGEKPKKADLREAALLVGMDHLDEVVARLREWGYDFQ